MCVYACVFVWLVLYLIYSVMLVWLHFMRYKLDNKSHYDGYDKQVKISWANRDFRAITFLLVFFAVKTAVKPTTVLWLNRGSTVIFCVTRSFIWPTGLYIDKETEHVIRYKCYLLPVNASYRRTRLDFHQRLQLPSALKLISAVLYKMHRYPQPE